jgi:ATP-dependent Clp protease ATP-binding subunit ClpA
MLPHNYIGTDHLLLGLIREGEGVAAQVLQKLGADLSRVRQQVIQLLSGGDAGGSQAPANASGPEIGAKLEQVHALETWAIDRQEFELAAKLRDIERALLDMRDACARGDAGTDDRRSDE